MSEHYRFFDSIDGQDERYYTADEFAEYFRRFIRNGIFGGGENLKVITEGTGMQVKISPGYAWIEGYLYKIEGEPLVLECGTAHPGLSRIDRVVIRLDKTLEHRYVKAFILKGESGELPEAPALSRNENVFEIGLARVEVLAGKSFIEGYQITDERLSSDACGLVTHLFEQIDTTGIFDEWIHYLTYKKSQSNASYDDFVAGLQSKQSAFNQAWQEWVDDKISEPAGEFYAEWKDWFDEVKDIADLVTKNELEEHIEDEENPHDVTKDQLGLGKVDNVKQASKSGFDAHLASIATEEQYGHIRLSDIPQVEIIPSGGIIMWSGAIVDIPTGWAICDGSNGTPDLRDRFIMGAGKNYGVGNKGGEKSVTLTSAQLPSHSHDNGTLAANSAGNHSHDGSSSSAGSHSHSSGTLDTGSDGSHSHSISSLSTNSNGSHSHSASSGNQSASHSHTVSGGSHDHTYQRYAGSGSVDSIWGTHASSLSSYSTGGTGSHSHTVGNQSASHSHSITVASGGSHSHTISGSMGSAGSHSHSVGGSTSAAGSHLHTVSIDDAGSHSHIVSGTTASTGTNEPHENLPPYYALAFIMKI